MKFEVTILGSGAAVPTLERGATAHYVNCNDRHILIDCGEGTQLQLRKYKIKFQRITHICISHLHGDHFFGLVGYLSSLQLLGRDKGVHVYGPTGLEAIVKAQLEMGGARIDYQLTFFEIDATKNTLLFEDRVMEIHSFPLKHRVPTTGFLIKEKPKERNLVKAKFDQTGLSVAYINKLRQGFDVKKEDGTIVTAESVTVTPPPIKTYAFCSDTAYLENIVPTIKNADLLYHEATFTEEKKQRAIKTNHSTALDAAKIAKLANAKQLIMGHFSARYKNTENHLAEAKTVFENSFAVNDGDVFTL
jgi:ribonuclease Z